MQVTISESKYWRLDARSQVPTGTDLILLFLENNASRAVTWEVIGVMRQPHGHPQEAGRPVPA